MRDEKALVSKIAARHDLKGSILEAVDAVGGFGKVVERGDEILLKPNLNTADPPPASSDPDFVKAVVELLLEHGAASVIVGESSMLSLSTRKVFQESGVLSKIEQAGARAVFFDEGEWIKAATGGKYLSSVSLPELALEKRKLVNVCCLKTHKFANFTLSLKLAVGFMKPNERLSLHMRHLEEKIADLNIIVHPSLVIMDGRTCFINGGPSCGELRKPDIILASGDRVAIDVEGIKTIQGFENTSLTSDPWSYTQIRRAVNLGLGVKEEQEYEVIRESDCA